MKSGQTRARAALLPATAAFAAALCGLATLYVKSGGEAKFTAAAEAERRLRRRRSRQTPRCAVRLRRGGGIDPGKGARRHAGHQLRGARRRPQIAE